MAAFMATTRIGSVANLTATQRSFKSSLTKLLVSLDVDVVEPEQLELLVEEECNNASGIVWHRGSQTTHIEV